MSQRLLSVKRKINRILRKEFFPGRPSGLAGSLLCAVLLSVCLFPVTGCSSCNGHRSGSSVSSVDSSQEAAGAVRGFPMVRIPSVYTTSEDRAAYMAEHYWDAFLSSSDDPDPESFRKDSLTILGVPAAEVEEHFASFVTILSHLSDDASLSAARPSAGTSPSVAGSSDSPLSVALRGMSRLFCLVEAKQQSDEESGIYEKMTDIVTKYLYDPNSPYRSEELYLPYVEGLASSPLTRPEMVPAYRYDVEMCSMNRIGTPAADFKFKDIAGRIHSLYGVKADYTLLFFSNPGCEACRDIIETIKGNLGLEYMISSGKLAVVNVYIDEDIDAWKSYQSYYPATWFNGYDLTYSIRQDIKYNVRAIPSLYLLDSGKRVIMKDAPEDHLFSFLNSLRRY